MKTCIFICLFCLGLFQLSLAQNTGIGTTTPDNSAILDISSQSKGFLLPRMTTAERNAIANPAQALQIFNTTTNCLEIYVQGWHTIWCDQGSGGFVCGTSVSDVDGNSYSTVQIGSQCWFTENLRTTKFKNNSLVTQITDSPTWQTTSSQGYCWYDNDILNVGNGALYNWYAVSDVRGLCPAGWHVPSHNDWLTLSGFLSSNASYWCGTTNQIAKSLANYADWPYSATSCVIGNPESFYSNASGFTAKPVGTRNKNGVFEGKTNSTQWWSSTISVSCGGTAAEIRHLWDTSKILHANSYDCENKNYGFSIRCIKD